MKTVAVQNPSSPALQLPDLELPAVKLSARNVRPSGFKSKIKVLLLGIAGSVVLRVLNATIRWQFVGLDGAKKDWPNGKSGIIAFWHGQQLLMPWVYLNCRKTKARKPIAVLISQHEDGRIVAKIMQFLGLGSIAGSSSRGGTKALFDLIDALKAGSHIAITPDGPKGPYHKLHDGIVRIAQRSGALIYPTAIAAQKTWTFGSWDKMFLPKPFSRAVLIMGEPILIPARIDAKEMLGFSAQVEAGINEVTRQAEQFRY